MSLLLTARQIGEGWESVEIGDSTYTLDQWLNLRTKQWATVPWFTDDNFTCRLGQNLRRPITKTAKFWAIWDAKGKLFKRYVLRQKS